MPKSSRVYFYLMHFYDVQRITIYWVMDDIYLKLNFSTRRCKTKRFVSNYYYSIIWSCRHLIHASDKIHILIYS